MGLMNFEQFEEANYDLCKFEHIFEDQTECFECGGNPPGDITNRCLKIKYAFEEYKNKHTDSEAIFVMMTVQ